MRAVCACVSASLVYVCGVRARVCECSHLCECTSMYAHACARASTNAYTFAFACECVRVCVCVWRGGVVKFNMRISPVKLWFSYFLQSSKITT